MSDITPHIGEIETILKKAAIDGTLTEEAINVFHATLKENEALKDTNRQLKDDNTKLDERQSDYSQRYQEAVKSNDAWAQRESDLKDREKECLRLELEAKFNEKRVEDHKNMFTTVFRNSVLRKEVMTPVHPGVPDQYGTRQDAWPQRDTVEEEET
jgi:predicted RNase H-like nuclease (RuvC/YqgF family)